MCALLIGIRRSHDILLTRLPHPLAVQAAAALNNQAVNTHGWAQVQLGNEIVVLLSMILCVVAACAMAMIMGDKVQEYIPIDQLKRAWNTGCKLASKAVNRLTKLEHSPLEYALRAWDHLTKAPGFRANFDPRAAASTPPPTSEHPRAAQDATPRARRSATSKAAPKRKAARSPTRSKAAASTSKSNAPSADEWSTTGDEIDMDDDEEAPAPPRSTRGRGRTSRRAVEEDDDDDDRTDAMDVDGKSRKLPGRHGDGSIVQLKSATSLSAPP